MVLANSNSRVGNSCVGVWGVGGLGGGGGGVGVWVYVCAQKRQVTLQGRSHKRAGHTKEAGHTKGQVTQKRQVTR